MAPKQSSIQLTDETRRQIEELAERWGLSGARNTTEIMTRCIERIWMLEVGCRRYTEREEQASSSQQSGPK